MLVIVFDPQEPCDYVKTLAGIAREENLLVLGMTKKSRIDNPNELEIYGEVIESGVDSLFTFYNDENLIEEIIVQSIEALVFLMNVPAVINLDFEDVKLALKNKGIAQIGKGYGNGEQMGLKAAQMACDPKNSPWNMKNARHFIIAVDGDVTLTDASDAAEYVRSISSSEADVVFGVHYDEEKTDACEVLVIASDFVFPTEQVKETNSYDDTFDIPDNTQTSKFEGKALTHDVDSRFVSEEDDFEFQFLDLRDDE
jgi:cell division GTPase FtsZ